MQSLFRKSFSLFVVVLLLVTVAVTTVAQEEVTFWMKKQVQDESNAALEARVAQFEAETGIKVNLEVIPYEDFLIRWSAAIESGNLPDVSFFGYQEVGQFYGQDLLLDLTDLVMEIEAENEDFISALLNPVTFEDSYWAVPFWSESTVLFYRKDLFEQAGLDGPPDTWEEFLDYAQRLTDPEAGVYGAGFGIGRANSDSEWWFRDLLWSHGAYLFNETGDASNINTEEAAAVFEWIRYFFNDAGVTPPGVIGWDDAGNNRAFLSGQAAMVINVGSIYRALVLDRPDLLEVSGVALVPGGPEGRIIAGISNDLGIFKDARNVEAGKQLVKYMLDKDWLGEWVEASGYLVVPVYPSLGEAEFWQTEAGAVFTETPQYYEFLGAPGPFTPAAGQVYNTRLLTDALEKVIVEGRAIEDVLAELEQAINNVIGQ